MRHPSLKLPGNFTLNPVPKRRGHAPRNHFHGLDHPRHRHLIRYLGYPASLSCAWFAPAHTCPVPQDCLAPICRCEAPGNALSSTPHPLGCFQATGRISPQAKNSYQFKTFFHIAEIRAENLPLFRLSHFADCQTIAPSTQNQRGMEKLMTFFKAISKQAKTVERRYAPLPMARVLPKGRNYWAVQQDRHPMPTGIH